jgi:hypothetical protein
MTALCLFSLFQHLHFSKTKSWFAMSPKVIVFGYMTVQTTESFGLEITARSCYVSAEAFFSSSEPRQVDLSFVLGKN